MIVDAAHTGVVIVKTSNIAELMAIEKRKCSSDTDSDKNLLTGGIANEVDMDLRARLINHASGWNLDIHRQDLSSQKGFKV